MNIAIMLMFLMAVLWLAAIVAGVLMMRGGFRGIEIDDHPRCRGCGYDLSCWDVRPRRCSECGSPLIGPGRVQLGRYRTNMALFGAGMAVLAICVAAPTHLWLRGGPTTPAAAPPAAFRPARRWRPRPARAMEPTTPRWSPAPNRWSPAPKMLKSRAGVLAALAAPDMPSDLFDLVLAPTILPLDLSMGWLDRHTLALSEFGGQVGFGAGPNALTGDVLPRGALDLDLDGADPGFGERAAPGVTRFKPGAIDVTTPPRRIDLARPGKPRNDSVSPSRYDAAPADTRRTYRPR